MQEWEEIERKLAALPEIQQVQAELLKRTSYYGQTVEIDGQGRLLLPPILRESADLKGEVAVSGRVEAPGGAERRRASQGSAGALT